MELLVFIDGHRARGEAPPTIREMCTALGKTAPMSTNAMNDKLVSLVDKGLLGRDAFRSRSYRLTVAALKLLGLRRCACGHWSASAVDLPPLSTFRAVSAEVSR